MTVDSLLTCERPSALIEYFVAGKTRPNLVVAEDIGQVQGVGQRLDLLGVDLGKQVHVVEDVAELVGHSVEFFVREAEPSEQGDLFNFFAGKCHGCEQWAVGSGQ